MRHFTTTRAPVTTAVVTSGLLAISLLPVAASAADRPGGDPDVVAGRAAASSLSAKTTATAPSIDARPQARVMAGPHDSAIRPAATATASTSASGPGVDGIGAGLAVDGPGEANHHSAEGTAWLSSLGGVRAVIPNDWAQNDSPGFLTTTVRIYGRDWLQTDDGTVATLQHRSELTCTGTSVSSISVGTGGVSVSGGVTSKTATIEITATDWVHYFDYYDGAEWRCKVSNLTPAKSTRRTGGLVTYGNASTSPRAEYSFIW